jgi:hypothetical protein
LLTRQDELEAKLQKMEEILAFDQNKLEKPTVK